jgi:hypothetical protein
MLLWRKKAEMQIHVAKTAMGDMEAQSIEK